MKDAYELFHATHPDAAFTDRRGEFDRPLDAARASGHADLNAWTRTQDGTDDQWRLHAGPRDHWGISKRAVPETDAESIELALAVIGQYSSIDGNHHKAWVLDQAARYLTRDRYAAWVAEQCAGEDGPDTFTWDEGTEP